MTTRDDNPTTGRNKPSFATLLDEVDGVFANARIAYSLTTVDRAMDRGEWPRALDALSGLAERLAHLVVPKSGWRELLVAAAWCAVRGSAIEQAAPILEAHGHRAWRTSSRAGMPWQLGAALEEADRRGRFAAGRELGRLVATLFPTCPLGRFAQAHFSDRMLQHGQDDPAPAELADAFEEAAGLADALDMPRLARRAKLRAGVVLLRSEVARERGRSLLRAVDTAHLSRKDALWYAVGMAHSAFWLDRVRAADQVLALAEADARAARGTDADTRADVVTASRYLLDCAPIELQPLELDRLEALAAEVDEAAAMLEVRAHLEGVAAASLDRAGEAADLLDRAGAEPADARRRAAVEFCRAIEGVYDGDEATIPDAASLARIGDGFPLAAAVVEALVPAANADAARLATALGDLEGRLRRAAAPLSGSELKPVALLWPELLPFLRRLQEADDDVDATTVRRIAASAAEIAARWLPKAPTPSYGWWNLAANLLACDMAEQAALAARRALDDAESVDAGVEERVVVALLDRAVREADSDEMLAWLQVAQARFADE